MQSGFEGLSDRRRAPGLANTSILLLAPLSLKESLPGRNDGEIASRNRSEEYHIWGRRLCADCDKDHFIKSDMGRSISVPSRTQQFELQKISARITADFCVSCQVPGESGECSAHRRQWD